jgi:hypothetical protein
MNNKMDVRTIMTGNDGRLYVYVGAESKLLAEVKDYEVKATFSNIPYKPLGDYQEYAIPDKVKFTLTFSEAVIRDDWLIQPIISGIEGEGGNKMIPSFDFVTTTEREHDHQKQRLVLRKCLPEGDFDLMSLKAGDVITRQQSFVINSVPHFEEFLKSE